MSDSTIDDALRLLETGKGNPDRLKQIIESFQKRSMISMQDRKYVDALVVLDLTPRHRQMTSNMKPSETQKTNLPKIRKITGSSFKITEVKVTSENTYIKPSISNQPSQNNSNLCKKCGSTILENKTFCTDCETKVESYESTKIIERASKESTIEEKFIEHIKTDHTVTKKSGRKKIIGITVGIIAIIIIGGGAAYMGSSSDLFSAQPDVEERITCQDDVLLVSTTKIPNFPEPGKDFGYYQDRYDNELKYKEWFDKNFSGQTLREVLMPQLGDKETIVPGFPDPEKDLQYYLDRYNNEPKYKEWFDKNFSGQTLREAVC